MGRSCADRLHQIQKDIGLTDKELKEAVREVARPREVQLPTIHEKLPKVEKEMNEYRVGGKRHKKAVAYWYLEEYLKPEYAQEIYVEHPDYKELVEYAYEQAMNLVQLQSFELEKDIDLFSVFPDYTPVGKYDIPEEQWEEFDQYCEKHPVKNVSDVFKRRKKFKKWRNKRSRKYCTKKYIERMYDPLFALTVTDEKEILANLQRISRENEQRIIEFHKFLDSLVADQSIGSSAMAKFNEQTKVIQQKHRQRIHDFMKAHGMSPTPLRLDYDPGIEPGG